MLFYVSHNVYKILCIQPPYISFQLDSCTVHMYHLYTDNPPLSPFPYTDNSPSSPYTDNPPSSLRNPVQVKTQIFVVGYLPLLGLISPGLTPVSHVAGRAAPLPYCHLAQSLYHLTQVTYRGTATDAARGPGPLPQ